MIKKSGILIVLLTGCLIHALGQETVRFHPDPVKFIQESREFFGVNQPETSRALLQKLESAQKDGLLEENQWIDLAGKANVLEQNGARPYPDYYLFLSTYLSVATQAKSRSDFLVWSGYLSKILARNPKNLPPVNAFLEFSQNFIQKGLLIKSNGFQWSTKPGDVAFGVDSIFFVTLSNRDIVGSGSGDSTVILSTSGKFYPKHNRFVGQGGRVTWEKLKIPASQVWVDLGHFTIDLSKSAYTIDSVNLNDKRYFTEPLIGRFENKILPGVKPETAGYPRFTSYELRNRIKNIYPGMDYEGGFSLQGLKVIGTGLPTHKSVLTVFRNEKPLFRLASTYFTFKPDQARAINTESSIYIESDSIYHPGLAFQYNGKQKELSLVRDGEGLSPSRFLNSYHRYDLNVDRICWTIGDSVMTMTGLPGSNENKASFESSDFFSMERFNEILIADKVHPVSAIKQCADHYYSRTYTLADLSTFMGKPQHAVEEMILRLSFLGFVKYNTESSVIEVQERAYDFIQKNAGRQDYDIIRFESIQPAKEINARLELNTHHLKVFAVKSIELSKTRKVTIFPTHQTIEILQNRDIWFDGEIEGGLVHFYGKQFKFRYDDFTIHLGQIDRLNMKVYEKPDNKTEEPNLAEVTSAIENTRGILRIDQPTNKSGQKVKNFPQYPILQTDTNAYVYYDQQDILKGIYPRESFNFNISPFTLRGLNLYSFSDSLIFPGRLMTGGIFPPLELSLKHQKDHSLGFETMKTPEKGLPVYGGKGRFYNSLSMSKSGLRGSGKLEYLNSVVISDDILFLPGQVNTVASLSVSKDTTGTGNPETHGDQMAIKWLPEQDKLVAQGTKEALKLYGGAFFGELALDPKDLTASGTLSFDGYSITSNQFKLRKDSYEIADGTLKIFRDSTSQKARVEGAVDDSNLFIGSKLKGIVQVGQQQAHFEPASGDSRVEFTQNRFIGKPARISWDIKDRMVLDDIALQMSAKPGDSLRFKSGQTEFRPSSQSIYAHRVEFIDVADVRIFPADQNMTIRKEAKIDSLTQATIVSRDTAMGHRVRHASVSITDHRKYYARGVYQYKDVAGRDLSVGMKEIQPNKNGVSVGKGNIEPEESFTLSPAFKYYGPVEWDNNERNLLFDGQVQLSHSCPNITLQWIRFTSRIDPESVAIPIDSITNNDQNERLFKGFFLSNQPVELYSTFIGPHTRYSDQPVISARGWLWFDESTSRYQLTSAEKRANPAVDGPLLTLDAKKCVNEAQGPLNLGIDLGQVKLQAAGKLSHDLSQDSLRGSLILATDFFFDQKALEYMARSINNSSGLEPVNFSDSTFREDFRDLIGHSKGEELLKQIGLYGKWKKIPPEVLHTLFFTNVDFKWNPETGSYQSVGKIGIGNILSQSVNKKMNGYLEIVHRRGGDTFTFYVEVDRQKYFYFSYSRGVMQCVAGPGFEKFNTMIRDLKQKNRQQNTEPGEAGYQYYVGTYRQVSEFLKRFNVER